MGVKVIDRQGDYYLLKYDKSHFSVDKINDSIGKSIIFSDNKTLVRNKFEEIREEIMAQKGIKKYQITIESLGSENKIYVQGFYSFGTIEELIEHYNIRKEEGTIGAIESIGLSCKFEDFLEPKYRKATLIREYKKLSNALKRAGIGYDISPYLYS
jgi:hypothetical protein